MENKELILDFLAGNQEHIKEKISDPINKTMEDLLNKEHILFKDEIKDQAKQLVKLLIANEITKSLALDYESAIIVLETINLEDFLKA